VANKGHLGTNPRFKDLVKSVNLYSEIKVKTLLPFSWPLKRPRAMGMGRWQTIVQVHKKGHSLPAEF
jgi:hypothetical protein